MTKTMQANGYHVQSVVVDMMGWRTPQRRGCWTVSVGQVARRAMVSKPTARKYLNMLVEDGMLSSYMDGNVQRFQPKGDW